MRRAMFERGRQLLLRDLAATANYLLFRRWNQSPTALLFL
jgi:hypothetical protein